MKRFIDLDASDMEGRSSGEWIDSLRQAEGRVIVAEIVATASPLIDKVSNPELAAAFGADILLLNLYDVDHPQIPGLPPLEGYETTQDVYGSSSRGEGRTLNDVYDYTGRLVGLNLEPIENPAALSTRGRLATAENALKAVEQGAALIVVTGNPNTGVSSGGIAGSVAEIRKAIGEQAILFAGKIHSAGRFEPVVTGEDIAAFLASGADGVVLPAPGTVPGATLEVCCKWVDEVHRRGGLALNGIGTSQESARETTLEQIALMSKMTGADVHHIGDGGMSGMAMPENIYAFSLAIRGRRHTWRRMASSLLR